MDNMINLKINGIPVQVKKGTKILEAAQMLHIDIPHLCYHPDQRVKARCRICSVEVVGKKRLLAACATECWDGMEVYTDTKIVRDTQVGILQLIMADHEGNCLTCPRNGNCDLQKLCSRFNVRQPNLPHVSKPIPIKTTNPSLVHDPGKCIKCGRCIRACKDIQGVEALEFAGRNIGLKVTTPYEEDFEKTDCVLCGQCTVVCPVGALVEKDDTDRVLDAIFDPNKTVIVQTAPAVRVALGDAFGMPDGSIVTRKMISALRMIGFDKVFDTNYAADITIAEEANELIDRIKNNKKMPMTTSCCPAWINFVEKHYPDKIEHLSSTKSPMSIFSAITKAYYAKHENIAPENIFTVAVMPCIAKKYEAKRPQLAKNGIQDTDAVITTRGLIKLIKYIGIDFIDLPEGEFDNPMGESTGAGAIFGTTGGVMEAALRTAYEWITDKEMPTLEYTPVRGFEGIKEAVVDIDGNKLRIAVVHTLKNAALIMDKLRAGKCEYDFIEVMACPGGCIGGGGQPVTTTFAVTKERMKALYDIDRTSELRKSHENPYLKKLYAEFLEKPGSNTAHHLLHTSYQAREKEFDFSK